MDIVSGALFVAIVYIILMALFSSIMGLPVPVAMALSLLGGIVVVAINWKRLDSWSRPSQPAKKPRDPRLGNPRLRSGNRAARRSKR